MDKLSLVYLIHFETPYKAQSGKRQKTAQHYCGTSVRFDERIKDHQEGNGNPLMRAVSRVGIPWNVVLRLPGGRSLERAMKNSHKLAMYCPVCSPSTYERAYKRLARKLAG